MKIFLLVVMRDSRKVSLDFEPGTYLPPFPSLVVPHPSSGRAVSYLLRIEPTSNIPLGTRSSSLTGTFRVQAHPERPEWRHRQSHPQLRRGRTACTRYCFSRVLHVVPIPMRFLSDV
jgi:hypothetical protein